ncbi:MAG: CHASE domain-containing protein [Archangium sp.]
MRVWTIALPTLIFLFTLGLTLGAGSIMDSSLEDARRARLDHWATSSADRLHDRLQNAAAVARGTAALFSVDTRVSPNGFHDYVQAQDLKRWFSEGHVSWVPAVDENNAAALLALGRRELPEYQFGSTTPKFPVVFTAPHDERGLAALGRELSDYPDRLAAVEAARDGGDVVLTRIVNAGAPGRIGVMLIAPIYAEFPSTIEERRRQFRGVIAVSTGAQELMDATFAPAASTFDAVVQDDDGLIWASRPGPLSPQTEGATRTFSLGHRTLNIRLQSRDSSLTDASERSTLLTFLGVGALLSFALAGLTLQQLRARGQAESAELASRAALEEAERRRAELDHIVTQSTEGIIMADAEGTIRVFNDAATALHGATGAGLLVPDWHRTWSYFDLDGVARPVEQAPLMRAVRGEVVREARWVTRRSDGTEVRMTGTASPLRRADGSFAGAVLVERDETQRLLAEVDRERLISALEASNAELDQFASVASHDLKAPLRGIAQLASWLEEDLGDKLSEENRKHLGLLQGRVRRLVALIDGILGYARAGHSTQTLHNFEPRAAASEAVGLLSPPEGTKITLPDPGLTINGDRTLLVRVLMNLVSNALKHGSVPGQPAEIDVTCALQGEFVRFAVRDRGPGIAPEYHERIWGMFQTLQPRDEKESTGIGLAVVRKVVRAQAGRTWLESTPGQGSTFFFTWPRRAQRQPT